MDIGLRYLFLKKYVYGQQEYKKFLRIPNHLQNTTKSQKEILLKLNMGNDVGKMEAALLVQRWECKMVVSV